MTFKEFGLKMEKLFVVIFEGSKACAWDNFNESIFYEEVSALVVT